MAEKILSLVSGWSTITNSGETKVRRMKCKVVVVVVCVYVCTYVCI